MGYVTVSPATRIIDGMARSSRSRGTRASMTTGRRRTQLPTRRSASMHRTARTSSTRHAAGLGQFSNGGHAGGRHHGGGYKGFKSKKQWRWAWATKQVWARKKSHETAGGPKIRYRRLPESKHSGNKGRRGPLANA